MALWEKFKFNLIEDLFIHVSLHDAVEEKRPQLINDFLVGLGHYLKEFNIFPQN